MMLWEIILKEPINSLLARNWAVTVSPTLSPPGRGASFAIGNGRRLKIMKAWCAKNVVIFSAMPKI
jgi:hypothetical protein